MNLMRIEQMEYKCVSNRRVISVVFLANLLLSILLSGCGGGGSSSSSNPDDDGSNTAEIFTLSGVAQKGLFTDLKVKALPVDKRTGEVKLNETVDAVTDGSKYEVELPATGIYKLEATGTFVNELTGEFVVLDVPLEALVEVDQVSQDSNINLLTHLYTQQVFDRLADGASLVEAISAAQDFVAQSLGFDPATDFTTLDMTDIQPDAALDDPNLQLLLFSAAILQQLSPDDTINDFGSVVDMFAGLTDSTLGLDHFAQLAGSDALDIYQQVQENNTGLPDLDILTDGVPVYSCELMQPCSWVPQPPYTVSVTGVQTLEADGESFVTVKLSLASTDPVNVSLQTVDGSAHAGADFVPVEINLLFLPGETTKTFNIPVILDNETEAVEYFDVQIIAANGGYLIANRSTRLALDEGLNGSDLNLAADQVSIESFCVTAVGDGNALTRGSCLESGLTAIPDNDSAALAMNLALNVVCDESSCTPWERDWAVEFVLEAYSVQKNLQGNETVTVEDSSIFARHRFPGSRLNRVGKPPFISYLYAHIDSAFRDLSQLADNKGWNLRIKARLLGLDEVSSVYALGSPLVLPETLQAGDLTLPFHISSFEAGTSQGVCDETEYQLSAEFSLDGTVFQDSTVCVQLDSDNNTVTLNDGNISIAGNTLDLPAFHSTFKRDNDLSRADVRGLPSLTVPGSVATTSTLYIHADGLPFAFPVNSVFVDVEGVKIGYDHVLYLQAGEYNSLDPRFNGVTSNDILFQSIKLSPFQSGEIQLTEFGIQTRLTIAEGSGRYAFPQGDIEWGSFTLEISGGRLGIVPATVPDVNFVLQQNDRCIDLDCVGSLPEIHSVSAGEATLDFQGAMLAHTTVNLNAASVPRWGSIADTSASAFTRPDDLPEGARAMLSLPGFLFSDDTDPGLDASLYAHQDYSSQQIGILRIPSIKKSKLGSSNALEGNLWPTGITVGPQYYADMPIGGVPNIGDDGRSLEGSRLILNNGIDTPFDLNVNVGAKYVIRNAGITGVFNIASQELVSPLSFYGYKLSFDRFAFRLVDNGMDDYSWIDGNLRIPAIDDSPPPDQNADGTAGAGGFDLDFASLILNCDGSFAGASPVPDPARPQSLSAWNAATDIYAMRFDNIGFASHCAVSSKILTLDQTLEMKALDGLLSLANVEWRSDGSVRGSEVLANQQFILDGSTDFTGFAVGTKSGRLQTLLGDQLYGVLKLDNALMTSYLWQSPRVDIRLRNKSLSAERSIVTTNGQIDTGDDWNNDQFNLVDNTQYDLDMKYNWGYSPFGFDLPVYYSSGGTVSAPRFIGRYKESDLVVLKAGAGIDFIEAEDTHLSFGLSADIAKIQELPLSLDLGDALSIARMDDFLTQSGLGSYGLQTLLGPFQQKLDVISSIAGSGLNHALRRQLETAIVDLDGVGEHIVSITQSLSLVQSFPNQFEAVLTNGIRSGIIELDVNAVSLNTRLGNLRLELLSITSVQDEVQMNLLNLQREEVLEALLLLKSQSDVARDSIRQSVTQAANLIAQLESHLQQLNEALLAITGSDGIKLAFKFDSEFCASGSLDVNLDNGHLTPVVELSSNIEALMNGFSVINIASSLSGLTAVAGEELQTLLENSERFIQSQAGGLQLEWNDNFTLFKTTVCADGSDSFTQSLDEFLIGTDSLLENSQQLSQQISNILADRAGNLLNGLGEGFAVMSAYLDRVIEEIRSLDLETDLTAVQWNGSVIWQNINQDFVASVETERFEVAFLLADPGSDSLDLFSGLITPVLQSSADYPTAWREAFQDTGLFDFSGASFNPDQFRTLLINKIMATAAINDIQVQVEQFTAPFLGELSVLNLNLNNHINALIKQALSAVNPQINDLLQQATSRLPGIPMISAGLEGSAEFRGVDLSKMQMHASWQMDQDIGGVAGPSFDAALVINANQGGEGDAVPCNAPPGIDSFEVNISAREVSAGLFGDGTTLDHVSFGFILAEGDLLAYQPVALSGGLSITTEIGYAGFSLHEFNFEAALGRQEVYIGAGGSGAFDTVAMDLHAFFGLTCDDSTVIRIDGQSAALLPFGEGETEQPFAGLYLRGGATLPIISTGCPLDLSVSASVGYWITLLPVAEIGGINGGASMGTLACIGSIKGRVDAAASIDVNGDIFFAGQAFAVAGAGLDCDRHTWTSVSRSRKDKWCGTGDIQVGVRYQDNKWSYDPDRPSAIH